LPAVLVAILAVEVIDARRQSGIPFEPPPRGPQEYGSGPLLDYVVLGDSTAVGQGAPYERGIAVSTARHLSARGRRVRLVNLAVSGAAADDVVDHQLERAARRRPELVLIAVGANDAIRPRRPGRVRADLERAVESLVRARCRVRIVLTGSPELGGVRVAAVGDHMNDGAFTPVVATQTNVTFAPIARETGAAFERDASLFAADGFHPSERGYATWLPVLERAIDEALAREPRGCG
jgi:lysophospholipase L1-like esterase